MSSAWIILVFAGFLEVCWAIGLKYTNGFTCIGPSVFTLTALAGSMYLLAKAMQSIPLGTAYAVWVGIGAIGTSILGVIIFKEPVNIGRIVFFCLLVISIVGLGSVS